MKQHLYLLALVAICFAACGPVYVVHQDPVPAPAPPPQDNPDDVTYQNFYDQLSPYGQWIEDPDYGYVWLPDAGPDFKPYATNGHWVYTDEGWTWDSGYPWGWAAFHYGRWYFQDGYGWMWIPGTEWAPAWVSWRNSDEYYGWAPMGPNVSFDVAYGGGYAPPTYYWNFVPHRYIASPQVNNYYVRETNNVTIINQTTVIRNTTVMNRPRNSRYGGGPDAGEVGRYSGAAVRPMVIRDSRTPGERADNGNLTIYRPRVNGADNNRPNNAGRPFAPSRPQTLNNARPVNRTVYGDNPGNNNGRRDDRGNGDRNNGDRNNGNNGGRGNNEGRTNTGFPNNRGNNPQNNPANQPANLPANRPNTPPANQPANPQANPTNPPVNRPVPPGNQPDNRFGRPFHPDNQPNQQQPQSVPNPQQSAPNQPGRQQQAPNQQQPAPSQPNQQQSVPNRPNQQQPVFNRPVRQQPMQPGQQQSSPAQPAGQPVQQQRPVPDRPMNAMPAGRPFNQQQANPNQPRPVVNPPKPEQRPATPPPPPKKDDPGRPGRS